MKEERMEILRMVEAGQVQAEEAAALLAALDTPKPESEPKVRLPKSEPPPSPRETWARYWIYPMAAGGAALFLGLLILGPIYSAGDGLGWLLCGWPLMLLGLAVVLLVWWSRRATWMHVKITEKDGTGFTISFPLPLTLAAWVLKFAQPFVPQLRDTGVDEVVFALRDGITSGEPITIDVEDDTDGERVQIYIG